MTPIFKCRKSLGRPGTYILVVLSIGPSPSWTRSLLCHQFPSPAGRLYAKDNGVVTERAVQSINNGLMR